MLKEAQIENKNDEMPVAGRCFKELPHENNNERCKNPSVTRTRWTEAFMFASNEIYMTTF